MTDENYIYDETELKNFIYKCKKHDVCDVCKKTRADLVCLKWGTKTGFICDDCQQKIYEERIAAFEQNQFDASEYIWRQDIKCPYCGHEYQNDKLFNSTDNENCPNCNSYFTVEIDWTPYFSIKKNT